MPRQVVSTVIPGVSPTVAPVPLDPRINKGTMMLIEPGHPYWGDLVTVPQDGTRLKNLAWEMAKWRLGGGDIDSLSPLFNRNTVNADEMVIERTPKGGDHFIVSKTKDVAGRGAWLTLPPLLQDWFVGQVTHGRYASLWARVTRAGVSGVNYYLVRFASLAGTIVAQAFAEGTAGNSVAGLPSQNAQNPEYVGRANANVPGLGRFDTGVSRLIDSWPVGGGMIPGFLYAGPVIQARGVAPSFVFYSMQMTDLAWAGMTYAQAAAIDLAEFRKAFSPGGRFHGDTWRDPATVLP